MEIYWIFLEILLTCIANLSLYSVCGVWGMVTPSIYHNIGSSDYNLTPSLPLTSTLPLSQRGDCAHCAVWWQHSVVHVYLFTYSGNMISYYWRQCTPNTRYMPCPPESSRWNTESCLYGSAVAHEETEGESLEHWDTGTITWPLHSSPCDPGPAPLLTSQHAARHWAMRCSE